MEDNVFSKSKKNKKYLYKYLKKFRKKNENIGPLKKGKDVNNDEAANILSAQYYSVFINLYLYQRVLRMVKKQ